MTRRDDRSPAPRWRSRSPVRLRQRRVCVLRRSQRLLGVVCAPPLGIADRTLNGRGYGLTFDDGPAPEGTPAVLEALARSRRPRDVLPRRRAGRAQPVARGRDRRRRPRRSACTATATATSCGWGRGRSRADIERGAARIEETTGCPIERYRPPYGIFNAAALALVHRNGWRPLLWTHWGRDWRGARDARVDRDAAASAARRRRGLGAAAARRRRLLGAGIVAQDRGGAAARARRARAARPALDARRLS